jgi:hypothetical protein
MHKFNGPSGIEMHKLEKKQKRVPSSSLYHCVGLELYPKLENRYCFAV